MKNRKLNLTLFGPLYEFQPMGDESKCAYCGEKGNSIDHIPSLDTVGRLGRRYLSEEGINMVSVPCCRWCNTKLGNKMLLTYSTRLLFLKEAASRELRAKSFLSTPEELSQINEELRSAIVGRQAEIRGRLENKVREMDRRISRL